MNRHLDTREVIDLGVASVVTQGSVIGDPELSGREYAGNGISED